VGDISKILEGRHFARYQALLQSDLEAFKKDLEEHAGGYVMSRYKMTLQGIVGPVYDLSAAFEKLAVALGRSVFKDAAKVFGDLADSVQKLAETDPSRLSWMVKVGLGLAALVPAGIALGAIVSAIKGLAAAFMLLVGAIAAIVGAPVWAVIAVIAAIGAAVAAAYVYWDKIKEWAAWLGQLALAFGQFNIDLVTRVGEALKSASVAFYEAGVEMMDRLWEGLKARAQSIVDWIKGLGASIKDAITGAGSWFGGGAAAPGGASATPPGRASGGSVTGGSAYIVGERGPELFVPGRSGTIVPGVGRQIVMSPSFHFTGQQNAAEIEERVRRVLREEVRQLFRGIQSDTGVVFA
jgi:hypothetical protein